MKSQEHCPIKHWVADERPREMLLERGANALSTSMLLAILLRTGRQGVNAEELGRRIYNTFGSLRAIDSATIQEMCRIEGVGPAKASQIMAALELGKRLLKEQSQKSTSPIKSAEDALQYVYERYGAYLRDVKKEFFHIVLLNIKNRPIHHIEISKGSISASIVDTREVVREATLKMASALILLHNHPSGETEPSEEDIRVTRNIVNSCALIGVKVLDHIIIGKEAEHYFSFARAGML